MLDPSLSRRSGLIAAAILLLGLASLTLASLNEPPPAPPIPPHPDGAVLRLGSGRFHAMALSPDGSALAVASGIGVHLHDSATLEMSSFIATTSPALAIAYAPHHAGAVRFAVGLQDGSVVIYWRSEGSEAWRPAQLGTHNQPVTSVAWSPDGRLLASASAEGHVKLWEPSTGRIAYDLADWGDGLPGDPQVSGGGLATVVAFNPDGTLLAAGHSYGHVAAWEAASGALIWHVKEQNSPINTITWLSDWSLALTGFGALEVWDVRAGVRIQVFGGGSPADFALSPSRDRLAALSSSGITIHDLTGRAGDVEIASDLRFESALVWTPDEQRIVTANPVGGTLTLWDIASRNVLSRAEGYLGYVDGVTWSPDADEILYGAGYTIYRWSVQSHELTTIEDANAGGSAAPLVFLPDGRTLLSNEGTGGSGKVYFRNAITGEVLSSIYANAFQVEQLAASPDGSMVAAGGSFDPFVFIFQSRTYTLLDTLKGPGRGAVGLAWSPDGTRLASLWADQSHYTGIVGNELIVWDTETQQPVSDIFVPGVRMSGLSWLPGDALLAVAEDGDALSIWDFERNARRSTLSDRWSGSIQTAAWSGDGALLALASDELHITVWDVATSRLLHTFTGHTDRISQLAWSPDHRFLASSSWDGTVLVWEIDG